MKILVFGAGAVGSMLGGFLARTGHDVSLLGRASHMDAVAKNGLSIAGIWGEYRIKALETFRSTDELEQSGSTDFDLIFLTVKAYDTRQAVQELKKILKEKTMVVSLQNGLGNIEAALEGIPKEQFLAGRIITGIELEPGKINITVSAEPLAVGALPGVKPKKSAEEIANAIAAAKVPCVPSREILSVIWAKVIYNCCLNAPCTLLNKPYGAMLETPERLDQIKRIIRECYQVAASQNVALDPKTPEDYFEKLVKKLIPPTAAHYPSMLRDLQKNRRTEIDSLNGAIAFYGRQNGVETPENWVLTQKIKELEAGV